MPNPLLDPRQLTGGHIKAARALLGLTANQLAQMTHLGIATIKRAELKDGVVALTYANAERIIQVLDELGVVMIPENGGGIGVRLKAPR